LGGYNRRGGGRIGYDPGFRNQRRQQSSGPVLHGKRSRHSLVGTPSRGKNGRFDRQAGNAGQMEEARKHFAYVMFASFSALLLGAGAAYAAEISTTSAAVKEAARPVT
jgi:hypothetical protein